MSGISAELGSPASPRDGGKCQRWAEHRRTSPGFCFPPSAKPHRSDRLMLGIRKYWQFSLLLNPLPFCVTVPGCSKTVLPLYPVLPVQPFSLCPVFGLAAEVLSSPVLLTLCLTPRREEKMQLSPVVTPGACWGQSRIVCKGQAKGAHLTAQAPTCSGTGLLREYLFYRKCLNMH